MLFLSFDSLLGICKILVLVEMIEEESGDEIADDDGCLPIWQFGLSQ